MASGKLIIITEENLAKVLLTELKSMEPDVAFTLIQEIKENAEAVLYPNKIIDIFNSGKDFNPTNN